MRTDNRSVTPTLSEVIQTMIDANLIELHVCLPAKIVKYDSGKQYADVIPTLLRMYEDGTPIAWPVIPNVPVVFPRAVAGQAYFHMPLVVGDDVILLVSERSLDNWKQTGTLSDPADRRKFNISDAFAIPGGSGVPNAFPVQSNTAVELKNSLSFFQLTPTGTINVKAPLVNIGNSASHGVGLGDVIESRLSALETALTALITAYNLHTHISAAPSSPTSPPAVPESPFVPVATPAASTTIKVDA